MADNDGYTAKQMLRDTLEVSGQVSLSDMYAKVKEMERQSLGLLPAGYGKPKKPMCFSATAAYKKRVAKTEKERRLADLMVFVAKYREGKSGIVAFPEWLSKTGRDRLLEIAKRRA
jgi:hypothetical protein